MDTGKELEFLVNTSLSRNNQNWKIRQDVALNGKEILDTLLFLNDEMQKIFNPNLLKDWYQGNCFTGNFKKYLYPLLKEYGLYKESKNGIRANQVFDAFISQHVVIQKKDLNPITSLINIIDQNYFDNMPDNEKLYSVTFSISHHFPASNNYFERGWIERRFNSEYHPKIAPLLSSLYITLLKLSGHKEEEKVSEEVMNLLSERLNKDCVLYMTHGTTWPEDIFKYENKYFTVPRKRNGDKLFEHNDTILINNIFGFGLYHQKSDTPLGYVLLDDKDNSEDKLKLLLTN